MGPKPPPTTPPPPSSPPGKGWEASFDFNDFRIQIHQMRQMGSMTDLISMIPGISRKIKSLSFDENQIIWTEAIINSMTPYERSKPELINTLSKSHFPYLPTTHKSCTKTQKNDAKNLPKSTKTRSW